MANYGLVVNSKFRPFEYQELAAPIIAATLAHLLLEDAYGDLSLLAGNVLPLINLSIDKDELQMYNDYTNNLELQAEELAKYGLSLSSRRNMLNARSNYQRLITPIIKAAEARLKLIEEQRKLGDSRIFDFDAATTPLSRFRENPSLSYRSIDRNTLRVRALAAFQNLQNDIREFRYDPKRKLDRFHNTLIQSYGLSPELASNFISLVTSGNIDEADAALAAIYNTLYLGTGVDSWNNEEASNSVRDTILEGVFSGIGKTNAQLIEDKQAIINALPTALTNKPPQNLFDLNTANDGRDYLDATGKLGKYEDLRGKLLSPEGNFYTKYLIDSRDNHNRFVNPMKVYEEFGRRPLSVPKSTVYYGLYGLTFNREENPLGARKQYGVLGILSKEEYDLLKELGYNANSTKEDFRDLPNRIKRQGSLYNHLSVRYMPTALDGAEQTLNNTWSWHHQNGKTPEGKMFEVTSAGTRGKPIKKDPYKYFDITDTKHNLTDVFYTEQEPDFLHIVYNGKDVFVKPSFFGTTMLNIVDEASRLLRSDDAQLLEYARLLGIPNPIANKVRNGIVSNTIQAVRDQLINYNLGIPSTNSKLIN